MPKSRRLFWQIFPSFLFITVIGLMVVTWYASNSLRHFFLEQTAADLEARAHLFERQILPYLDPLNKGQIDRLCKDLGKRASTRFTVILPSGEPIGDSAQDPALMDTHLDRPEIKEAMKQGLGTSTRYSRTTDRNFLYVALLLRDPSGPLAVLRAAIPVNAIDATLHDVQFKILIVGVAMALIAAFLSLLVSRRIARPIQEIKNWAEAVARGESRLKPTYGASDEIEALSESITTMAAQLRERIDTVTRQSHEIEAILSSMVEGVIAVDMEERIISINHAAAQMFSCNPAEAEGRSIQEVVRNIVLQRFVTQALSSDEPVQRDISLSSNGEERFLSGQGTVLRDAEGDQIGALIVLNDVTHLRRLEDIRRDFVANVSHEIKTPITAIKGFVETLRDGAVNDTVDAQRFLGIIDRHVDRLEAIVEDLLALSRIEREAEEGEIVLVEGSVKDILRTALQVCHVRASEKDIKIGLSCTEDLEAKVDHPLLEQAVVNLLDNAIKYSDQGGLIQVEAARLDSELVISVRDHGCGIEKKHLPRLFERFYRVDKARSRRMGGTGLGLAIVKHIVQAHGGRLFVESTPGQGSAFTIHLPGV